MSPSTPPERSPAASSANQSLYEASERSCRARSRTADHAARAGGSGGSAAGRSATERVIYPQALSTVVEYKGPARGEGWGPSRSPGLADYSAGLRALAKARPVLGDLFPEPVPLYSVEPNRHRKRAGRAMKQTFQPNNRKRS